MDGQISANRLNYQPLWLQYFAEYLTNHGASVKTRKNYCTDVQHVFTWVGLHRHMTEDFSLDDIRSEDLEAYKLEEARNGVPRTTINRRLSALRMFFCYALEMALVRANPMKSVVNIPAKQHTVPIEVIAAPEPFQSDPIPQSTDTTAHDDLSPYYGMLRPPEPMNTRSNEGLDSASLGSNTLMQAAEKYPPSSAQPQPRMPWTELAVALLIIGVLTSWFFLRLAWDQPLSTTPRASVAGISTEITRESASRRKLNTPDSDQNSPLATNFGNIAAPTIIITPTPEPTQAPAASFGLPTPTPTAGPTPTPQDILSPLAESSTSGLIDRDVTMARSFNVLGDTLLTNTTITGGLTVGALLHFSEDGIDTYSNTFYIQKERFAGIDLGGGALTIDTEGSVRIPGNLTVAGSATFSGVLAASTVIPYGDQLTIDLTHTASDSGQARMTAGFGSLLVQGVASQSARVDASGSAYLTGNVVASGSGSFSSLAITGKQATGTTNIVNGLTEAFVLTTAFNPTSLLSITPLASTGNQVLYIKEKIPGKGFIVAIDKPLDHDIPFNWWIVN